MLTENSAWEVTYGTQGIAFSWREHRYPTLLFSAKHYNRIGPKRDFESILPDGSESP